MQKPSDYRMNSFFMSLAFSFLSLASFGQVFVGEVNINEEKSVKIIEVLIADKIKKSINVFVDFGQKSNFTAGSLNNKSKDQRITDPVTKIEKVFNTTSEVLNFMESNGWEHYDSLVITDRGFNVFYYYFKRKL